MRTHWAQRPPWRPPPPPPHPTFCPREVDIDLDDGRISVCNSGRVPIFGTRLAAVTSEWFLSGFGYRSSCATLKSLQVRVPELIFGTLLTGSNDDDERDLTTGGRNG